MFVESMYQLGARRSCIRELFEYGLLRARQIGAENVYDYSLGNPSVPAPGAVDDALRALSGRRDTLPLHSYTSAAGSPDVRAAVSRALNARYAADLRPENLFFTCGAAPALVAAVRALAVEAAEFVLLAPYFPEYVPFVTASGARPVIVPPAKDFRLDAQAVMRAVTRHTQAVIINSPNNPSGVVYTREELAALAAALSGRAEEYGRPIYILADEPYRELAFDGVEVPFLPEIYPDTIVCYSWSKSLSLPGERIGYVLIPDRAADSAALMAAVAGAARVSGHVCAPSLAQHLISECAELLPDVRAYERNRDLLYTALREYGYACVRPDGAFYMLVRAPGGSAADFSARAKERELLVVPGDAFGCPEYFRLSICVSPEMILRSLPVFRALAPEA